MLKVRDMQVNQQISTSLVVMSAVARETKAKKPYLQLEMYDGTDTIQGNYWDWNGKNIPPKNAILITTGQVTEYMGNKQLNIKSLVTDTEHHLAEFMPTADINISDVWKEAYSICSELRDNFLRQVSMKVLEDLNSLWLTIPGAKSVHHAFVGGTLVHSLSVAKIAMAVSRNIPESNPELCFVGGLLHDIGKLYTYRLDGITIDMTDNGKLYEHTFIGAEFIGNFVEGMTWHAEDYTEVCCKLELLRHIILSHHGMLEYGAAVTPQCIEAHIVHHADGIDAATQQIVEQSRKYTNSKWTDRIYTLSNRPQLTVQYVKDVFSTEEASVSTGETA